MATVYVETTVIGLIAARDQPDPVVFARQQLSRTWWQSHASNYELRISDLVLSECAAGDSTAAKDRLKLIDDLALLAPSPNAERLAELLIDGKAIPESEPRDAAHVALAANHRMDFLVTWNFKHILNPHLQHRIDHICRAAGFEPATICTPEQLLEAPDEPN